MTEESAPTTSEGCYLSYLSDSGGKLELQYSRTPVENAVGFWAAGHGKKIQVGAWISVNAWEDGELFISS